jgi:small subunit ribosomal protein S16
LSANPQQWQPARSVAVRAWAHDGVGMTSAAAKLDEDCRSMSVRIRLARAGTKKRPVYRIVATDSRDPRDGRFLEKLGTYNPILPSENPQRVVLREERLRYWLGVGALPSDRVARFLDSAGITQNATRWRGTGKRAETIAAQKAEAEAQAAAAAPAAGSAPAEAAALAPAAADVTDVPAEAVAATEAEAPAATKAAAESEAPTAAEVAAAPASEAEGDAEPKGKARSAAQKTAPPEDAAEPESAPEEPDESAKSGGDAS